VVGDPGALNRDDLASLLALEAPLFAEEAHRRWLLALAPFRPRADHPLYERARRLVPDAASVAGAALLVGEHRGSGALFWLSEGDPPERLVPFRGEAREQVELARRLVPRALPALVDPSGLDAALTGARRAVLGATDPGALDGSSFGLAICLAMASSLLELPIATDLVALARLDEMGRCLSVGHVEAKLDVLTRWALGVQRVLVSVEQRDEAERIARALGGHLSIVPVASLADAMRVAFGDVEDRLRARWMREPERARRAAKALLSLARDGYHRLLDWSAVGRAARGLALELPDGEHRWMAELAAHIAERHRGAPREIELRLDWLARQPRPFRLKLWAHIVQSAADGVDAWRPLLERAEREVAERDDQHAEDLELAGALGRAHAAWYAHLPAMQWLERATRGWLALEEAHRASYAIAELLRVAGCAGNGGVVDEAIGVYGKPALEDPRTSDVARAFISVAIGRALVATGAPERALRWLDDGAAAWADAPPHAALGRLRWRAAAFRALGDAQKTRAAIDALPPVTTDPEASAVVLLARADAGERDLALEGHALLGRELARLAGCFDPSDGEAIALLCRHSRY
jgi:hypothetical protein